MADPEKGRFIPCNAAKWAFELLTGCIALAFWFCPISGSPFLRCCCCCAIALLLLLAARFGCDRAEINPVPVEEEGDLTRRSDD